MAKLLLLLLLATLAAAGPGYKEKMMKKMAKHFFDQMCWGKENMRAKHTAIQEAMEECGGEVTVPRAMPAVPRVAALHTYTLPAHTFPLLPHLQYPGYHRLGKRAVADQETAEFLNDWMDFKGGMEAKIGNLTCVFKKMDLLTASGDVGQSPLPL